MESMALDCLYNVWLLTYVHRKHTKYVQLSPSKDIFHHNSSSTVYHHVWNLSHFDRYFCSLLCILYGSCNLSEFNNPFLRCGTCRFLQFLRRICCPIITAVASHSLWVTESRDNIPTKSRYITITFSIYLCTLVQNICISAHVTWACIKVPSSLLHFQHVLDFNKPNQNNKLVRFIEAILLW